MSKDAWSAEALWFQFAREGVGWLAAERCKWKTTMSSIEKKALRFLAPTVMKILLVGFWNVCTVNVKSVKGLFGADFWGILHAVDCLESSLILYMQTMLLFSVLSPYLVLCVCHDGDIRAVWIIQKQSALTRWLSLYTRLSPSQAAGAGLTVIIHDTRCLWSGLWRTAEPSITFFLQQFLSETHHAHPCCQGHFCCADVQPNVIPFLQSKIRFKVTVDRFPILKGREKKAFGHT